MAEAALLLHPPGSFIPRKMGAPHTLRTHLLKLPAQHRLHGLRDQSLPPVGAGDPVADLRLPSPLRYLRGEYADGADGYKVFAVIDASGTYSKMAQEITLARVVQAGVVPMDTAAVASELQRTWNRPDAAEWAEVYTKVFPAYQLLIESYSKAQDVVKNNEQLDSQR